MIKPAVPPMPAELTLGPDWAGWVICCETFELDTSHLCLAEIGAAAKALGADGPRGTSSPPRWLSRRQ